MSNDDGNAIKTQNAPSLPLDLLAPILSHLGFTNRLSTLSKCSQVCRTWYQFSKPHLWRRLWFRSQDRVRLVFTVLGSRPDLCAHVKIIELRVYPLGLPAEELETLEENVGKALRCMWNLEELTWTRTGSLSNRLLPELLFSREKLHTLELTGNTRFYNVDMLWKGDVFPLPNLRNLSFILPDLSAINATIQLAQRTNLRSIMIFCQHTSVFQPVHADLLSESLSHLEKLVLVGCKRLDAESVCKLVKASRSGIRILGLEGCAVHPTKFHSIATPLAQTLRTLSLTLPRPAFCSHSEFYTHLGELVSVLDNLTEFTLYAPGGVTADEDTDEDDAQTYALPQAQEQSHSHLVPKLPLSFVRALLTDKRTGVPHCRLTLLRIHGIICSTQSLNVIGTDASPVQDADTGLQDLVLQLESGPTLSLIAALLPLAPTLQKLHILSRAGAELFLTPDDVSWIARSLINYASPNVYGPLAHYGAVPPIHPPTNAAGALKQIGFRNIVWEVDRSLGPDEESQEVVVSLNRWDASEGRWPEAMLVVKA